MSRVSRSRRGPRNHEDRVRCRICGAWLRIVAQGHLRVHGVSTEDYKRRFDLAYVACPDLRARISQHKSSARRSSHRRSSAYVPRTRAQILAELRGLPTEQIRYVRRKDPRLITQASYVFGGWPEALEAAGHSVRRQQRWSRQRVLEEIRRRAAGRLPLDAKSVTRQDSRLVHSAQNHFGGWTAALAFAGLDPRRFSRRQSWSREQVCEALRRRTAAGRSLKDTAVRRDHGALHTAARKYFGTWMNALEALGLRRK